MVDIAKQDMSHLWAQTGDILAPDNAKIDSGWAVESVPRQWWNWMQNRADSNIAYMLQKGFPEWDTTTEYIVNKSYVQYAGVVYKCIQTNTNQTPASVSAYWTKAFPESSASLEALKTVTPATDTLAYFTSASAASTTPLSAFARTILDDVDAAAVRATISAQQLSTALTALSGTTPAANALPYYTGATTAATTTLSAFGRSLIDDADAAAGRTTLGLGTISTQSASSVAITGGSITGITDLAIADGGTGASTVADARTNLGLGTAATYTAQTSTTDTTANALLLVGAFGLGSSVGALLNTADLNTITVSGLYGQTANSEATFVRNYPIELAGTLIVERAGASIITQKYTVYNTGETYYRAHFNSTWFAWRKIFDSSNISTASIAATQLTGTIDDARLPATISSSITGNAATATVLQTARTINGVSFNGSANITVADSTKLPLTGGTLTGAVTINEPNQALSLKGTANGIANQVYMAFHDAAGARDGYIGIPVATNRNVYVVADAGDVLLYPSVGAVSLYYGGALKLSTVTGGIDVTGTCTADAYAGNGSGLTSLNASNLTSGTVAVGRGGTGATSITGSGNNVLSISPTFTGTPVAPTAATATNTTQIATTAFVHAVVDTIAGFTQSLAINGWTELPNGLIIQWGRAAVSMAANASANFTFPRVFGGCYSLTITGKTAAAADGATVNYTALSASGFTANTGLSDGTVTEISWMAFGV